MNPNWRKGIALSLIFSSRLWTNHRAEEKAYDTCYSQEVSYPGANQAQLCLASEIRRDQALPEWSGRKLENLPPRMHFVLYSFEEFFFPLAQDPYGVSALYVKKTTKSAFFFFLLLAVHIFTYLALFFSFSGIIDSERKLNKRVTTVTKSAYYPHKDISTIEDFLSKQDAEKPTHVFLFSRSDGCNGVFAALSKTSIRKLQLAQNAAARVLPNTKKLERITALLRS